MQNGIYVRNLLPRVGGRGLLSRKEDMNKRRLRRYEK
jgi:hypothetical protein